MNDIWFYTLLSVLAVSLISFIGIFTFSISVHRLKTFLIYLVSFSAGALFGDAFIHLLPEVFSDFGFGLDISLSILSGILVFFILEKIIYWHHCHMPITKEHIHTFSYMNLIGDGLHNFIDGIIIAVSFMVNVPVGIATTIAVVLHEIPQEIGDFGVLLHGGFSKGKALLLNFITAAMAILGAVISLLVGEYIEGISQWLVPFAAGGFIYIAGSDLIPELHKETKLIKSFLQIFFFSLGIVVMMLLLLID